MSMNDSEDRAPLPAQDSPNKDNTGSGQWSKFLKDEKVQLLKQSCMQYLRYGLSTLAHPYRTMKLSQSMSLSNTAITIGLVLILSAFYCFTWFCKLGLSSSFSLGFLKPLLLTAIGLVAAFGLSYTALRIEKITIEPKLLVNRFASLLVPTVMALLFAIVLLLTGMLLLSSWFLAVAYLFIFVGMNVIMLQYPLNAESRVIDSFYTIVAVNIITGYIFYKVFSIIIFSAMGGFGFFG